MLPELGEWTIVVAGTWNVGIFAPAWVSAHAFGGAQVNIEMQLQGAIPMMRFRHGRVALLIHPERLMCSLLDTSSEAINEASTMLRRILTVLSHTPVAALGFNFGFRETAPPHELTDCFSLADNDRLVDAGAEVREIAIQRNIKIDDGRLNLTENLEENGALHFGFNFHYDVANATNAAAILEEKSEGRRDLAISLMQSVYGLEMEEA